MVTYDKQNKVLCFWKPKTESKTSIWKKFWNAWNLNFKEVNLAVVHFVTQFSHVLDILDFGIERRRKFFKENCFEIVVSENHKNDLFCPYNPPKILNAFMIVSFYFFIFCCTFSKSSFVDTSAFFVDKSETTFSKQFPLKK